MAMVLLLLPLLLSPVPQSSAYLHLVACRACTLRSCCHCGGREKNAVGNRCILTKVGSTTTTTTDSVDADETNPLLQSRRTVLSAAAGSVLSIAGVGILPADATAAAASSTTDPQNTDVIIDGRFAFAVPSKWKIITKAPLRMDIDKKAGKATQGTLFSAIDFQSGSVLTVVEERACDIPEYARSADSSSGSTCDLVLPSGTTLFSGETVERDLVKLLIRHDDRDNAVLQGTSKLDSYELDNTGGVRNNDNNNRIASILATTTIPSGGTYRDGMGIDRPNTIDRIVKAKSLVVIPDDGGGGGGDGGETKIVTLWLSAPSDEWQKPVMGTKLNQTWKSVRTVL